MKLEFIDIGNIDDSAVNMRHGKKAPDVSDILPTVRKRGIIVPVILRPSIAEGRFELVAGRRRVHAARIAQTDEGADPELGRVPSAIMEAGDDAAALEASLIENLARLDPDEVTQWETFTRLVKEGREVDDIAATFGLPDLTIRRVLALGNPHRSHSGCVENGLPDSDTPCRMPRPPSPGPWTAPSRPIPTSDSQYG